MENPSLNKTSKPLKICKPFQKISRVTDGGNPLLSYQH